MMNKGNLRVPQVLKLGSRGSRIKIWTFLYLNSGKWFTKVEICEHLDLPESTAQLALEDLRYLPRIESESVRKGRRGRPEKKYRFSR